MSAIIKSAAGVAVGGIAVGGGRILTLPPLVGVPKFLPMIVVSGFCECAQVAHACWRPELSRTFEAALTLAASRFDGSRADGPTATMDGLIVHSSGMGREIVLFAQHHLSRFSFGDFQSGYLGEHFLLASMPQLVAQGLGPLRGGGFIIPVEGAAQTPQVFAGMIEVEHFG
jgi:hypothetical protein